MSDLSGLLRERYGEPVDRADVLWAALMCCQECDCRMIEHDEVAMQCRNCDCDQSGRGLSAYADEYLIDLGQAVRDANAEATP